MPVQRVNGVDIKYELSGDGPPIVFIHGFNLTREIWEPQVDALEPSQTVLRYDLRGHGDSDTTSTSEYSYELLADDLNALLESLETEDPIVCGHSLGAGVATKYATRYPNGLSHLVLVGAGLPDRYRVAVRRKLRDVSTSLSVRLFSGDRAEAVEEFFINLLTKGPELDPEELPGSGRIPEDEQKKYAPLLDQWPADFQFGEIRVPTLILAGEYEPFDGSTLAEQVPTATYETIPNVGHLSNWQNPQAFTSAFEPLLSNEETAQPP